MNLILGEELLPHHVLNTTSTICELKFGEERKLVVHYKYDEERKIQREPAVYTLDKKENYQEQIKRFVRLEDSKEREKTSCFAKVEIFWPHELLEVNLTHFQALTVQKSSAELNYQLMFSESQICTTLNEL